MNCKNDIIVAFLPLPSCGVVAQMLDYSFEVSVFDFLSQYYVYFWTNTLGNAVTPSGYGLNSATTVLFLQGWLKH